MIFDGINLKDYMHAECARPLMVSPTVSTSTVVGREGFDVASVELGSFDVGVECYVLPDFPLPIREGIRRTDAIKRIIASKLYRTEKCKLIFDDDPTRYNLAIMTGISDVDRTGYVDSFTVTFTCDPISFALDETTRELSPGSNTLVVGGTYRTWPSFEMVAEDSSVALTDGNGQSVTAECSPGSVVNIDMDRKRVTIDGVGARVTISSRFFQLEPGANTIQVTGGSGSVTYREAWL